MTRSAGAGLPRGLGELFGPAGAAGGRPIGGGMALFQTKSRTSMLSGQKAPLKQTGGGEQNGGVLGGCCPP
jgi:hypothetical protein